MSGLVPRSCKLCRFVQQTAGDFGVVDPSDVQPVPLAENDYWIVALNENQATLGRVYLVSKRHETDVARLSAAELESLWEWVRRTGAALGRLFAPDHFNYMFLMNVVAHAHFHIYPRYAARREFAGEEFVDTRWGGHYDSAEERRLHDGVRDDLAAAIRRALAAE